VTSSFEHLRDILASLSLVSKATQELLSTLSCNCSFLFILLVDDQNPANNRVEKSKAACDIEDKSNGISLHTELGLVSVPLCHRFAI
jgi:hypothetical protein